MADPTTKAVILHVGVVQGCIACGECERICPEVFDVRNGCASIRADAERHYQFRKAGITEAEATCPTRSIRVRYQSGV